MSKQLPELWFASLQEFGRTVTNNTCHTVNKMTTSCALCGYSEYRLMPLTKTL